MIYETVIIQIFNFLTLFVGT